MHVDEHDRVVAFLEKPAASSARLAFSGLARPRSAAPGL
ncbi:hypothetical protein ACIKT0_19525 [Hansschlegelia beijingensis]